ncbi:MAG: hypothetical protein Q4B73_04175 [Lachnospiraceae bacterium]|nr:hypothetical protein [Lachnospiraceae bacterium]
MKKMTLTRITALFLAALLTMAMLAGCGKGNGGSESADCPYDTAVDMLNVVWDNGNWEFPAVGGNFESSVDNAPGALPISDTDTMTAMLLIPEDVQAKVKDAATVFHMMNTNMFTGAALILDGMSADEAATKLKEAFLANQFMCGAPEKIVIYTVGTGLVYAYGLAVNIDEVKAAAEKLEGAKLVVEENYM